MTPGITIRAAQFPRDMGDVERLCWDYRDALLALGGDSGQFVRKKFTEAFWNDLIQDLPRVHKPPRGVVLLADRAEDCVGCAMLHPLSAQDAEIKRVYVADTARGTGAGAALTIGLIDHARSNGYTRLLLDTTKSSYAAARLYEKLGFRPRGPSSEMSDADRRSLLFFELPL